MLKTGRQSRWSLLAAVLAAVLGLAAAPAAASSAGWPTLDAIQAEAYAVYDRSTGQFVFEHQADRIGYPASTTKIMTALLALEELPPDLEATVSEKAVTLGSASSKVGLLAGEVVQVSDLIAGLLVASGNDAANVLAETLDGTTDRFALRMNSKATELGLTQTHFCNPSGLHDDNHVTTARELALLTDYALDNEQFRALAGLSQYVMPPTNLHPYPGWGLLNNSNRLLLFGETAFQSAYIARYTGVKTGSTYYAGNCLVAAAELVDGRELISVILGARDADRAGSTFIYSRTLLHEAARQLLGPLPSDAPEASATPAPPTPLPTPTQTAPVTQPAPVETGTAEPPAKDGFWRADPWRTAFILLVPLIIAAGLAGRRRRRKPVKPRRVR